MLFRFLGRLYFWLYVVPYATKVLRSSLETSVKTHARAKLDGTSWEDELRKDVDRNLTRLHRKR
jgi:hypothetical protein